MQSEDLSAPTATALPNMNTPVCKNRSIIVLTLLPNPLIVPQTSREVERVTRASYWFLFVLRHLIATLSIA